MEWLNYAGVGAICACIGVLGKAWFDHLTAQATSTVQTKQVEVNADEVNIKQQDASTNLLKAVSAVYETLVKGLADRVALSEHDAETCRSELKQVQAMQKSSEERWEKRLEETKEDFQRQIAEIHKMYQGGRRRDDAT